MLNPQLIKSIQAKIRRYVRDYENKRIEKPTRCENECCAGKIFNWWSGYSRHVRNLAGICVVPVKRARCKTCGRTFVVLPEFIKKFCRYGKDVIKHVLTTVVKKTYEKISEELYVNYDLELSPVTIWMWKTKYVLAAL